MTVDYAHTRHAEGNRQGKAHAIAVHAWRHGMTGEHLQSLDEPTRRAFARDAAVRTPSAESWAVAVDRLVVLWEHADHPSAPEQDLTADRGRWGAAEPPAAPVAAPGPGEYQAPAGWALVVALGPLAGFSVVPRCKVCGADAVVGLVDGWRCGEHPPAPGEWGSKLDFTPSPGRACRERCYCGRCPSYRPLPPVTVPREEPRRARR